MFNKEEAHNLMQLKEGYTLKVQATTWSIKEIVEYDWGVEGKSIEYTIISNNGETAYLEVERYEGDYEITFATPANLTSMTLEEAISTKSIVYNGVFFEMEEQYQGAVKNQTLQTSWTNVKNYIFYDEDETMVVIESLKGEEHKAYYALPIKEKSIKNIKTS